MAQDSQEMLGREQIVYIDLGAELATALRFNKKRIPNFKFRITNVLVSHSYIRFFTVICFWSSLIFMPAYWLPALF